MEPMINEMVTGVISTVKMLLIIIIPLFIVLEILIQTGAINKLSRKLRWFAKLIKVDDKAILPLLVAILMGVSYGAGTLMELNKENPLSKRDFMIIGVFMYMCHSLIETTLLFTVIGANVWYISVARFVITLIITMIIARSKWIQKYSKE